MEEDYVICSGGTGSRFIRNRDSVIRNDARSAMDRDLFADRGSLTKRSLASSFVQQICFMKKDYLKFKLTLSPIFYFTHMVIYTIICL